MPEPVGAWDADGHWKKTSRVWIPEISEDVEAELDKIAHELKLEDRGRADGQHNKPAHGDKTLNEVQLSVCSRVYSGVLRLNQFLDREVDTALKRARALVPAAPDMEHVKRLTASEVERIFGEHRPLLVSARREDLSSHRTLRYFISENRLRREAHYEESVVKVAGIVAGMFVLESIINGSLFGQVVDNGLVGGAILAGMISAINIMLGAAAGLWGWRNMGHRKPLRRVLGGGLALLCHGLALYSNLIVAHFREVAEALASTDSFDFDLSKLTPATVEHIQTHGLFGVDSLPSWALLLLGIFIHFLSAKEGWDDFADRYPDYKKYDVRAKAKHAVYEEALATLRDDVREAIEQVEAQAQQTVGAARSAYGVAAELVDLALERQQEVRDSENEWVAGGNRLLKTYRETNFEVRDKMTAPAYFDHYPSAAEYRRRKFGGDTGPSDEVEERARRVDSAIKELSALRDQAKAVETEAQGALKEVNRHITIAMKAADKRIDEESLEVTRIADSEPPAFEQAYAHQPAASSATQPTAAA